MKEIHLRDEPSFYDLQRTDEINILVSKYEEGEYDGSGEALLLRDNNVVEYYRLGHCSCYGPFDGGPDETYTLEEFLEKNKTVTTSWSDGLSAAFLGAIA